MVRKNPSDPQARIEGAERLPKLLSAVGVASRRTAEELISQGRVQVNGRPARLGQRVSHGNNISVDGKAIKLGKTTGYHRILLYHKPVGEVVTRDDPQGRPTVFGQLPRLTTGQWIAVGRLDINTSGLLIFTTSGDLADTLMHPRNGYEREYAVRIRGALSDGDLQNLLKGRLLDDGVARLDSIEAGEGQGSNRWYRVVLREGRNREVRRIFESVGHVVSRLMRVRFGPFVLPRGLRPGRYLEVPKDQVASAVASNLTPSQNK